MFEDDPQEYIHMILDVYDESNSPEMAVVSLIFTLSEKRTKTTIEPILQFSYQKLTSFADKEETLEIAKEKESVFRIIGSIANKLISEQSPFKSQMEQFLSTFIVPGFKSKFPFVRARTCETLAKFDGLELTNEQTKNALYQGVLDCFNDTENLPVQLEGALALQAFLAVPEFKEVLGTIILPTMEKLLDLSNKIDSDTVSAVIQECIENYSSQLQPFAVNLMTKIAEQLMRLLTEIYDGSNVDAALFDDDALSEVSDKTTAAMGIFNTIITILLYFENSTEIISKLEVCYLPIVEFVLVKDVDDFFTEAFELIENTSFLTRSVSPNMWKIFEIILVKMLENTEEVLLNFDEMLPALKNYLIYGRDVIRSNSQYQVSLLTFIVKFFEIESTQGSIEEEIGLKDISMCCDLASNFVLTLNSELLTEPVAHNLISIMTRVYEN
ncbi:unnamed protein product [Ambrosiozyma monospora]|uniref:Unnamed protein product n=1 Tax=Ambrosiozyma monospora TaxID=43982 RepID=A0ACB5TEE4_AMBMO|nr:unnamed protein product [Ambrosiozyma monospora]